jgi:hypothetical protein
MGVPASQLPGPAETAKDAPESQQSPNRVGTIALEKGRSVPLMLV